MEIRSGAAGSSVLLITGKGDETRQKIGKEYIPCPSDAELVQQFLFLYDKTAALK